MWKVAKGFLYFPSIFLNRSVKLLLTRSLVPLSPCPFVIKILLFRILHSSFRIVVIPQSLSIGVGPSYPVDI
jgi:hypothetical protein